MKFVGAKSKIAKEIVEFILKENPNIDFFIEPFCGAVNITCALIAKRPSLPVYASDISNNLIRLWCAGVNGEFIPPPHIARDDYYRLKAEPDSPLRTFTGYGCSFSGKWWGGYAEDSEKALAKSGKKATNYCLGSKNSYLKKIATLSKATDLQFGNSSYVQSVDTAQDRFKKGFNNAVIYCDPPYITTLSVGERNAFDHVKFWDWVREYEHQGATVYVSEYEAPEDFEAVWTKTSKQSMQRSGGQAVRTEKLFRLRRCDVKEHTY